jgi:6-phosphofructokinase 1
METGRFAVENLGEPRLANPLALSGDIQFVKEAERLAVNPHLSAIARAYAAGQPPEGFEIAGPRELIYFEPVQTKAAIVTCGGLCPGINAVVRALVLQLWYRYNCRNVVGIRWGYGGLAQGAEAPTPLDPDAVGDIHTRGGTVLGSSRGTPPASEIVDSLARHQIDVLFSIGGDGTMRGATAIWDEIKRRGLKIAVVSVPKTIDNDIPFVRRTFGFETAVAVATQAVHSAHAEATGAPHGIGLVKLMGRHAGYIAANTCMATGHANFCLVPEVPFALEGPGGLLELLETRIAARRHAVVVVAEGAGQYFFDPAHGGGTRRDASGNVKLGDIGLHLKERINEHFAARSLPLSLKYIDPSYIVRSAAANPTDQLHCTRLAQNAVHAAMAGKSGLLIGNWHGLMTHVPTRALQGVRQSINPKGELWFNVLEMTGQPETMGRV